MTTPSEQLIGGVHPALSASAIPETVLTLTPTAPIWLSISDTELTIARQAAPPIAFALADYTLGQLVAALPDYAGAALVSSSWASVKAFALTPLEGIALSAGATAYLAAYTAILWRALRPMAHGLAELRGVADVLERQIDIRQATGPWLDLWGLVWAIPRLPAESDAAYRNRIIYTLTLPRANNQALEILIFRAFGRIATVRDGDLGGILTMNNAAQVWGATAGAGVWGPQQVGYFVVTMDESESGYTVDQLVELIREYKAAGTLFSVNTRFAPIAELFFVDVVVEAPPSESQQALFGVIYTGNATSADMSVLADRITVTLSGGTFSPADEVNFLYSAYPTIADLVNAFEAKGVYDAVIFHFPNGSLPSSVITPQDGTFPIKFAFLTVTRTISV